jgi:hypothetical protein
MTNSKHHRAELLQERLGLKITARLSDASDALPHDIAERLRHARMQAVSRRKAPATAAAEVWLESGASAVLGSSGPGPNWWQRMGAALPVLALVVGLVAIEAVLDDRVAQELANVDAALLMDDLPPAAYADPGFLQFLKLSQASAPGR